MEWIKYFSMEVERRVQKIPKYLEALDFNKDGELAIIGSNLASRKWNGVVAVFSDASFAPEIPHIDIGTETEAGNSDIQWIDEKRVLIASDSGAVDLWTILDDRLTIENSVSFHEHDDICCSVSLDPSRIQFVSCSWDASVKVWDLAVEVSVHNFRAHICRTLSVSWSQSHPDLMTSASEDGDIYVYDVREVKPASLLFHETSSHPCAVTWHPTDTKVAAGFSDGKVCLLDMRNPGQLILNKETHSKVVNRVAFSHLSHNMLGSVSDDLTLHVYDTDNSSSLLKKKVHEDYIRGLAWDLKTTSCWTCAWDGKVVETAVSNDCMDISH